MSWSRFFVDYAMAAAAQDDVKKQQARADLDGYRNDIDAFLTGANPNLPKGAVAQLFAAHVTHLTNVIDDMVTGDTAGAYDMLRMAAHQTSEIMDPCPPRSSCSFRRSSWQALRP
jgi:hypothetical protein